MSSTRNDLVAIEPFKTNVSAICTVGEGFRFNKGHAKFFK